MSITKKFLLMLIGVTVIVSSGSMISLIVSSSQESDGLMINLAGRQRMLSQKTGKELNFYLLNRLQGNDHQKASASLAKTSALFEQTISAMLNGGTVTTPNGDQADISAISNAAVVQALQAGYAAWTPIYQQIQELLSTELSDEKVNAIVNDYAAVNLDILAKMNQATVLLVQESKDKSVYAQIDLLLTIILVVVLNIFIYMMSRRLIFSRLKELQEYLSIYEHGDLQAVMPVHSHDEIGAIKTSIQQMIDRFKHILADSLQSSTELGKTSNQLKDGASRTTTILVDNAQGLDAIATSAEEINQTVNSISDSIQESANLSSEIGKQTQSGNKVVLETVDAIARLNQQFDEFTLSIEKVKGDSDNINEFVSVIQEVAEQTNLLALNAAIEAARAGEQGRGFAVVADEVRKLAQKTHESTNEIQSIVTNLQNAVGQLLTTMHTGKECADDCSDKSQQAQAALTQILDSVLRSDDMNAQVATAAEQQSVTLADLSRRIEEINLNASETKQLAEEFSTQGNQIAQLATGLQQKISYFKV